MSTRTPQGRIRNSPARQRKRMLKALHRSQDRYEGAPRSLAVVTAEFEKLPRSWLESVWDNGGPFRAMKAQHATERVARVEAKRKRTETGQAA